MDADVSTPTARGGQTLVRLKMRNLLTSAVFEKTFKASDKFKEPDLQLVPASYLYSDGDGSHFLDQESYETLTLTEEMVGNASDFLIEGILIQLHKYNGNPIGLQLPMFVELNVAYTEPARAWRLLERQRDQGSQARRPASRSAFPSSSKKEKRSKCRRRTGSLRAGHKLVPNRSLIIHPDKS